MTDEKLPVFQTDTILYEERSYNDSLGLRETSILTIVSFSLSEMILHHVVGGELRIFSKIVEIQKCVKIIMFKIQRIFFSFLR